MADEPADAVVVEPRIKALFTPQLIAPLAMICGLGLAVAGVYVLAGTGWALLTASVPLLLLSAVLIRGLLHAE